MAVIRNIALLVLTLFGLCACAAEAADRPDRPSGRFAPWLNELEQEAIASGISAETTHAALDSALLDERVIEYDHKQPEKTVTFDDYIRRVVTPDRIAEGRRLMEENATLLNQVSAAYGVQPEIIVALWGMESSFGKFIGHYNTVDSLMTLAFEGRRAEFFRKELIEALRILDRSHLPATALRGSWAGAMGQCQFMPSTYLRYAVDYDNNGVSDIWTSPPDVFASIANYIAAEGWHGDQGWGQEVHVTRRLSQTATGLDHTHTLAEWVSLGIHSRNGGPLNIKTGDEALKASLVQPDGEDGRSFLVYDNFRALMRWNRSTYFATSVGLLADRIEH